MRFALAGALVGRSDWLRYREPFLAGGGAVDYVGVNDVLWTELPDRQEAGSPNVLGAVALGVACRTLQVAGMGSPLRSLRYSKRLGGRGRSCRRAVLPPVAGRAPEHRRVAV